MSGSDSLRIGAIILAAGLSSRMGRTKALLPLEGKTFVEILVDRFVQGEVKPVVVVVGPHSEEIQARLKTSPVRVVVNPRPERGQLSSLHHGLDALPDEMDGVFVAPVDTPRIRTRTLRLMVEELGRHPLVVPRYLGRRGHPTLFAAELFGALRRAPLEGGARVVVRSEPRRLELDTDDAAVSEDFDLPHHLSNLERNDEPPAPEGHGQSE